MSDVLARRPKFRKTETLIPRLLSAIVLIPLSLWIIYIGPPYSLIFGVLVTIGLFIEWGNLCRKIFLPFWSKVICIILGTLYLLIATLFLLFQLSAPGTWTVIYFLLCLVWSTDTFAYIGGRLLKGPKLAPSISPNKTWSGFITGMIGGTTVAYIASFWLLPMFSLRDIMFLVLIAQLGDLLESKVKRWSDVKDSSSLIPGHGGLLDRLDSLLAVAFILAVLFLALDREAGIHKMLPHNMVFRCQNLCLGSSTVRPSTSVLHTYAQDERRNIILNTKRPVLRTNNDLS